MKLVIFDPHNTRHEIDAAPGLSLMEAIRGAGIDGIIAECGGTAACATCHVFLDEQTATALGGPADHEAGMLDFAAVEATPQSRLSCQVRVSDMPEGAEVVLPETQL